MYEAELESMAERLEEENDGLLKEKVIHLAFGCLDFRVAQEYNCVEQVLKL